jgi:hypothetical protein
MKQLLMMQILTEIRYRELLPGFIKPVMSVKTLLVSRWWGYKCFHSNVRLTETRQEAYEVAD